MELKKDVYFNKGGNLIFLGKGTNLYRCSDLRTKEKGFSVAIYIYKVKNRWITKYIFLSEFEAERLGIL